MLRFQSVIKLCRAARAQDDLDIAAFEHWAQKLQLKVAGQSRERSDAQGLALVPPGLKGGEQFLTAGEDRIGVIERNPSCLGQHQRPPPPLEQFMAKTIFEQFDLGRHGGLRNIQRFGSAREITFKRDGLKIAQVMIVQFAHCSNK